jgi:hypothetical protein
VSISEEPERQHRRGAARLPDAEGRQEGETGHGRPPDPGVGPAVLGGVGRAVHQPGQARCGQGGRDERERDVAVRVTAGQQPEAGQERAQGAHHVDQEAPAPAGQLGHGTADDQPDDRAAAGDRAVHREGTSALAAVGEHHRDRGERRGREHRGARPLDGPSGDQHLEGGRAPGDGGSEGEATEAAEQRGTTAHAIRDATADEQEAGEGERVGGDHPLPPGVAEAEVTLGGRQSDGDDGGVERGQQLRHRDHAQGAPASGERRALLCLLRAGCLVCHGVLLRDSMT